MPSKVEEADGVTEALGAYLNELPGPLLYRQAAIESKLKAQLSRGDLVQCPSAGQIDPELWPCMVEALKTSSADAARRIVGDIRYRRTKLNNRNRQRAFVEVRIVMCTAVAVSLVRLTDSQPPQ